MNVDNKNEQEHEHEHEQERAPEQMPENVIVGAVVYATTMERGKLMLRRVPIAGLKDSRKVLTFIKHRIHGGRLKMSASAVKLQPVERPEGGPAPEESVIIMPPQ